MRTRWSKFVQMLANKNDKLEQFVRFVKPYV
jgi:hypothetical protein